MSNTEEIQLYSIAMVASQVNGTIGVASTICHARSHEEALGIAYTEARKRLPERDGWRDHIIHAQAHRVVIERRQEEAPRE